MARIVLEALQTEDPVFRMQTSDLAMQFVGTKLATLDGSLVTRMTGSEHRPA